VQHFTRAECTSNMAALFSCSVQWRHRRVGRGLDPPWDWIGCDDCDPVFFI